MTNDKVVNTRISQKLYEKIASKAKKNRITVSNLIRNLVEDTLEIHEDFHDAVDKKIRKYLVGVKNKNVLGYQEVVLAKNTTCENCEKPLKSSEKAYFAFLEDSNEKIVLCSTCKHANTTNS